MTPQQLEDTLDKEFGKLAEDLEPGSAIAVIKDGEVILDKGYGMASIEHKIPISNTTVFDLASLSKQFTGYAISLLIEEGKISEDDDIRKYIAEVPDFGDTITIGHLLHHTSGIRDWTSTLPLAGWSFEDVISFDDILRMAYDQESLNFRPGDEYIYSNTGYNLLAELVQRVTGASFADWMDERIFDPLKMANTFFMDDHSTIITNRAYGYFRDGQGSHHVSPNNLTALGSSSMYSTTTDLTQWVLHLSNPPMDKKSVVERMVQPGQFNNGEINSYAFGITSSNFLGIESIGHSGSWASFSTFITMLPEYDLSIIVLCNHPNSAFGVARTIASSYIAEPEVPEDSKEPESEEIKLSNELLKAYQGTYKLGPGWYVDLTEEDGQLWTQATNESKFPMTALSDTSLLIAGYGNRTMTFYRGEDDQIAHLIYNGMKCPRLSSAASTNRVVAADYIGEYYSDELHTSFQVSEVDGQLQLWNFHHGGVDLNRTWGEDFNTSLWFASSVDFFRNDAGEVEGFKVWQYRSRDQVFRKRK